jgi:hypothetical protein
VGDDCRALLCELGQAGRREPGPVVGLVRDRPDEVCQLGDQDPEVADVC